MGFSYEVFHDKNATSGITINGKNLLNYHPHAVSEFIHSLPDPVKLLTLSKIEEAIMGDSGYKLDKKRRLFHYQPDFTKLKKSLKNINTIYLYVHKLKRGLYKMNRVEESYYCLKDRKSFLHPIACPACKGAGVLGTDYCSVCVGIR